MKLQKGKTGVSGEYFVAAELSRRGYVASISLKNTKGIDILVSSEDGSMTRAIQVKSSSDANRSWILSKKAENDFNDNLFYIFVNLKSLQDRPEYYIVPSKVVAKYVKESHASWLSGTSKSGKVRNDTTMRKFDDLTGKYLEKWELLGLK
ncbi:MAG: hypothetical protein ACOYK9_06915 [Chlamydiia bacterium]